MKSIYVLAFYSLLTVSGSLQASSDLNHKEIIGWAHSSCLAIENPNLVKGDAITLHLVEENEATIIQTSIGHKATSSEKCPPLQEERSDINKLAGYSFYTLDNKELNGLSIGVVSSFKDLDLEFDYCTTSEGVNFKVANNNAEVW
jgi:hypothetical protein